MFLGFVVFVAILSAALWFIATYNQLGATKQRVAQTWANIDVLLRQRHDELPKLVEICGRYLEHDRDVLDRVLAARSALFGARHSFDSATLGHAEAELRNQLGKLFAVAESYPDLKANQSFSVLQQRISNLEAGISERRDLYNDAVKDNNVAIEQFPGSIVAPIGGFHAFNPLEFEPATTADVDVKALSSS